MSQNNTINNKKNYWMKGLGILGIVFGVLTLFQNCGQRAYFPHKQAYAPVTKLQEDLVQTYGAQLSESVCVDARAYRCDQEIFSAYAQDASSKVSFDCYLIEGVQICPDGEVRTYDSSKADTAQEYERFYCYHNLSTMDGAYPLQGEGDDIAVALLGAYQSCLNVVEQVVEQVK